MADEFCLKMPNFHVRFRDLLHAVNLRHGTNGFTSLPKEGVLRIFFSLKNPTASAGFEPANWGSKGQHATFRPPKPLATNNSNMTNARMKDFNVDRNLLRHNQLQRKACHHYNVIEDDSPYYKYIPSNVLESRNYRMYSNHSILTRTLFILSP